MTGAEALGIAVSRLKEAGVRDPAVDARVLLASVLGIDRARLLVVAGEELPIGCEVDYESHVAARVERKPVSQIIGYREFYGRRFKICSAVLDPRPETERLVEVALEKPFSRVLDLGTGSGCILLTLLAENSAATGLGVDCSDPALGVAQKNAILLTLAKNVKFANSNWFENVNGCFDLIVSNPPYISATEMNDLSREVRDWEPRIALTPEGDGLGAYRSIIRDAARFLNEDGRILLEIGPTQASAVTELLQASGFEKINVWQDIDGRDRVVETTKTRKQLD